MSMRSSFVYGFGFNCDCDNERLVAFIKAHKETFCKTETEVEMYEEMLNIEAEGDLEEFYDFFDDYYCDISESLGKGAVIANIMSRETGIRFVYCPPDGDCDTYASVLFEERCPWHLNEVEKGLTEENLSDICQKYIDELGIAETPDYLSLEYFG